MESLPPIRQYATRNAMKALALFASLSEALHPVQLTNRICKDHGVEGFILHMRCTEAEFKAVRATLADVFPSSSPEVTEPEITSAPDTIPTEWLN